jgi:FKBP-type peptidyl-prolyl isomerase-like protein
LHPIVETRDDVGIPIRCFQPLALAGTQVQVLRQIPPAYPYGARGSGSTIPGNTTLWFVIDVDRTSSK